jgi:hypothetical protein
MPSDILRCCCCCLQAAAGLLGQSGDIRQGLQTAIAGLPQTTERLRLSVCHQYHICIYVAMRLWQYVTVLGG